MLPSFDEQIRLTMLRMCNEALCFIDSSVSVADNSVFYGINNEPRWHMFPWELETSCQHLSVTVCNLNF